MFNAAVIKFNEIQLFLKEAIELSSNEIIIKNGDRCLEINELQTINNSITIKLNTEINIKHECFVIYKDINVRAIYREIFHTEAFNSRYYTDIELGNFYSKDSTVFRVWSPAAEKIDLLLYKNGDPEIKEEPKRLSMSESNGLWSIIVYENLKNFFYTYEVTVYGDTKEAVDPYAKALGINGLRGAIIDLKDTNPEGFSNHQAPSIESFTEAIIYETSVRDISTHPDSGVKNTGKFLGLSEESTKSSKGLSTALNHILEMGVTHVQLMPMYDFSYISTDERNSLKYNWGYDPQNYNAPEGSYSTNPYDPIARIYELKFLIQTLHKNNLCVNMDVVYNHVFNLETENLQRIFPGYYFRFFEDGKASNGSGCSNDTASERPMMRRFIVDSVYYWAKEYHLDGFRFDLMGLHDVTTMNAVREKLNTLEKPVMLYGEGWILGTMLPDDKKANQLNAKKMPHIGHFNDTIRNAVRGSVFIKEEKGFASGMENLESTIKYCAVGCTDYACSGNSLFNSPDQAINYVSAHDNNTLWDKLKFSNPEDSDETLRAIQKLSNAIVLTSQGIPFLHSGVEFCRTKYGIEDSVRSEDHVNWMDWDRKAQFIDVTEYYKGLIKLRREHNAFKMNNVEQIRKHLEFLPNMPRNTVGFMLKNYANGDCWKDIIVIYNANKECVSINIPDGTWNIVVDKNSAGIETLRNISGNVTTVESISMTVMYR
ncbi:pullulanase, type I [Clostridiales bacterium oral taxon 876 str. F0540]|nr:pullulanase, type I [Clostridiales bacterium oral taxon 876 str. F0540]